LRLLKYFYLIVLLFLVGCISTLQKPDAVPSLTQRNQNVLPPTWTLTPSLPPTETPVRSPTLTFTPLPSATSLPPTITTSPTSNVPTSTGTPTKTPKLVTDCYFWAVEEGVEIHSVPFEETFRLLPTMIPSVTYQAITYHPTFFELMLDGESVG